VLSENRGENIKNFKLKVEHLDIRHCKIIQLLYYVSAWLKMVRFCFLFFNPNPLTSLAVLQLIREAIGLDNKRTKPSFQYSQLDANYVSFFCVGTTRLILFST